MSDRETREPQSGPLSDKAALEVTPERWRRIKEILLAAEELDPKDRSGFLRKACGSDHALLAEVESLLTADDGGTISGLSTAAPLGETGLHSEVADPLIGRRVGAYDIVRQIGHGGMAVVYLAVRADDAYHKQVAVKIVRSEMDSAEVLSRFHNERQTLAGLDHPNIVRLIDGGSSPEGRPYLVMDHVEGTPIDEYCDGAALSVEKRLGLFCKVCAAVQYAHQNRVVHRDLKPSNILVTAEGVPKLLDFGIAKVLHPDPSGNTELLTRTDSRRMTPAYASPEQVRGDPVTVASDVYSLGVVLYELLTGHRPYRLAQATPAEMERAIREQEPQSPSTAVDRVEMETRPDGATSSKTPESVSRTREGVPAKLRRRLCGDLDTIVLSALHKEPQRRYASVEEFAGDIQRHLVHLPVKARRTTLAYRTSRFVARRKSEVIAAALMATVAVSGISYASWRAHKTEERVRAELISQRSKGRRAIAVLGFKNLSGRPDTAWLSTAIAEMLTTELAVGEKLRTIPGEEVADMKINLSLPETDTLSRKTLARVHRSLDSDYVVVGSYLDLGAASRNVRLDLQLQDAALGETIAAVTETGDEAALPDLVARAGADLRGKLGIPRISPAESASVQSSLPSNPEALRLFAEGLAKLRTFDARGARDLLEKSVGTDPSFAPAHSALADAWAALGYDEKANAEAKKAWDLAENLALPRERSLTIQARYYRAARDWDKAADLYRTLFTFFPDNLDYGLWLAEAQAEMGKPQDGVATLQALRRLPPPSGEDPRIDLQEATVAGALSDYQRVLAAASQAVAKGQSLGLSRLVAQGRSAQGGAYRLLGDLKKSLAASSEARQLFAASGDRFGEANALLQMGAAQDTEADLESAKKSYQAALPLVRDLGNKAMESAILARIAGVLMDQRDMAGSVAGYQRALALAKEIGETRRVAIILHNLGLAEKDQGQLATARHHFEEALPIARHYGDKGLIVGCLINLAHVFAAAGDVAGGRKLAQESLELIRQSGSKPRLGEVLLEYADLLMVAGDLGKAERLYAEAQQIFTAVGMQSRAAYWLFGMGDILLARGDLAGARKQHEAALTARLSEHGQVRDLFDSRLRLAQLALEEGRAGDAETAVQQALREYPAQSEPDAQVEAHAVLVRSLLTQNKLLETRQLVAADNSLAAHSENNFDRLTVDILGAQLAGASGNRQEAVKSLQSCVERAAKAGFGALEMESRLALGEAELQSGNLNGLAHLRSLERTARSRGFILIARKAAAARARQ